MVYLIMWKDLRLCRRRQGSFFLYSNLSVKTWIHWHLQIRRELKSQYVFPQLYDTIKEVAKTFAAVDRYYLSGVAKGTASSDISLGAFNVPQGSVRVTAGGQILRENIDYTVDYTNGSVKVINQSIINPVCR